MSTALDTLALAETPEGIELALRPAGVVPRALAYATDFGLRLVVLIAAAIALGQLRGLGMALLLILYFLLEWWYPVVFELMPGAATPGKRLLGLKVVMDNGLPITPAASLVRNLLRAADQLPGLYAFGIVSMLLRPDFKRLGDLAAGTLVVHHDSATLHGAMPAADPIAPRLPLDTPAQAAVVAWAGRIPRLTPERAEELAALAEPVLPAPTEAAPSAQQRLLAVAHWLLGRRSGAAA